MTDLFDQQITDGLHRAAASIAVHHGSLPDVRRRVRARRARHVAAVSLPAVAGLALVGLRQTPAPNPLSSATAPELSEPGVTGPASPTSTTTVESTGPASPASTTAVESTTAPPGLFDGVVCLDATPDASVERCLASLPGARPMTAPSYMVIKDAPMFVVPADPAYQAEAQALSDRLGLPFRPDITGHLHQDLAGTDLTGVRVFVVLGTTDTTVCTIPACRVSETTLPDLDQALGEQVAHAADVF
jgi:hypothetical protein